MSGPFVLKPGPAQDPYGFANIAQQLQSGIQTGFERRRSQDILDQVISQAQQGEGDLLTNILTGLQGSGATLGEGLEAVQRFTPAYQAQQQAVIKGQESVQDQQQRYMSALALNHLSGGKIPVEMGQSLTQSALNMAISNFTRQRDVLSPQEEAFKKLQDGVLEKLPSVEEEISLAERALQIAQKPGVGVDFQPGNVTDALRQTARFLGINIGQTADEAQLTNLTLQRADELKRKFGARITNFDFEKWLEGQPSINKFRNANIAIAMMQRQNALQNREFFDAWQSIVSNPSITPDQRTNAFLNAKRDIIRRNDEELEKNLQSLSETDLPNTEKPQLSREDAIKEAKRRGLIKG